MQSDERQQLTGLEARAIVLSVTRNLTAIA